MTGSFPPTTLETLPNRSRPSTGVCAALATR